MRAFTLLFMMLFTFLGYLKGQTTITLTFTAEVNGNHQPLDSILVQNLTQGGDSTLYAPDTILVLTYGIGIDDRVSNHGNQIILFPPYPNPITHSSSIRLRLPHDAPVTLRLFDLQGLELFAFRELLDAGEHTFAFTAGRKNLYVLIAEVAGQCKVQKLVSLSSGEGSCHISYSGQKPAFSGMRKGKSSFPWAPGNNLRYIGYSSNGTDTIDAQPSQSTQYIFQYYFGPCPPTVTDYNGNVYNTILIGTQCWMKENLKARNYKNGTTIPNITDDSTWASLTTGARCWYNNDSAVSSAMQGSLYNWYAVDDANGLCPTGWHVPTDQEWQTLEMHLGMSQSMANSTGWRGTDEGGKLKEAGISHWASPNTGATNSSGFTALPGGPRGTSFRNFNDLGKNGYWWSSATYSSQTAWSRLLYYMYSNAGRYINNKHDGYSVRCIKDP